MQMVSIPRRLQLTCALIVLSVPFAIFETVLMERSSWWNLPVQAIQVVSVVVAIISLPLAVAVALGNRFALGLLSLFAGIWVASSALAAIEMRHFWLGSFTLFLAAFWMVVIRALWLQIHQSFYNPQVKWYQAFPRPLPSIEAKARGAHPGIPKMKFQVSRFDQDGAFVFFSASL